jgi:hypothetical protein
LFFGKNMHNDVITVNNHPTGGGFALRAGFEIIFCAHFVANGIGQGIEHSVAAACANDKIVGKGYNALQVDQDDLFGFFFFKGVDNGMGNFKRIQGSPRLVWCG